MAWALALAREREGNDGDHDEKLDQCEASNEPTPGPSQQGNFLSRRTCCLPAHIVYGSPKAAVPLVKRSQTYFQSGLPVATTPP